MTPNKLIPAAPALPDVEEQWQPGDCPMCAPGTCPGGAHRNALHGDGIETPAQYAALPDVAEGEKIGDHVICSKHGPKFGFCEDCAGAGEQRGETPQSSAVISEGGEPSGGNTHSSEIDSQSPQTTEECQTHTMRRTMLTADSSQEAQPLPAPVAEGYQLIHRLMKNELARGRNNGLANEHAIELIEKYSLALAEISRLSSPIFKSFSHMIGAILDRIDMAPNDDPIPYIREYVDGLRKSHLTDLRKD